MNMIYHSVKCSRIQSIYFSKYMFAITGGRKSENHKVLSYYGYAQDLLHWKVLSVTNRMWNIKQNMLELSALEYMDRKKISPYSISVHQYLPSCEVSCFL